MGRLHGTSFMGSVLSAFASSLFAALGVGLALLSGLGLLGCVTSLASLDGALLTLDATAALIAWRARTLGERRGCGGALSPAIRSAPSCSESRRAGAESLGAKPRPNKAR